jgi:naphthalene 1,2-dioxygenase system ferredoxin subunit
MVRPSSPDARDAAPDPQEIPLYCPSLGEVAAVSNGAAGCPRWVRAMAAEAVREGAPVECSLEGRDLALYRVGAEVFATDNLCTHGGAWLCEGFQDGYTIECPLHQGVFDIRTGGCKAGPVTEDLAVYKAREIDGSIEIELEDPT